MIQILMVGFLAIGAVKTAEELPSFLHVCHRNDPELNQCFKAAGEDLRPYLVEGVPEYHIPKLEPLIMDQLISEDLSGLHIEAKNVKAWGCSEYFIRNISVDIDNQKYVLDVYLPELKIEAHYSVNGKLLLMPVKGEGPMEANITRVTAKVTLDGEIFEKDNDHYLKYKSMNMKVNVGDGKIKLSNLFDGDKVLNDVINHTINKNLDMFLKELLPVIEKSLSAVFLEIANRIVFKFTFEQLFPE